MVSACVFFQQCNQKTSYNDIHWLAEQFSPGTWCNVYAPNDGRLISTLSIVVYSPRFGVYMKISTDFIMHSHITKAPHSRKEKTKANNNKTALSLSRSMYVQLGHVR